MLLHLQPSLYSPFEAVALVDLTIEAFALHLQGGTDLVTRRPYPNKRYAVACRKQGRKALDGILIETTKPISEFTCVTRWAIAAERLAVHHVRYRVLDSEFDAATESMVFWYAFSESLGGWSNRWPEWATEIAPVVGEATMEVLPPDGDGRTAVKNCAPGLRECRDRVDERGWIVERHETFAMPTIERQRLLDERCSMHRGRMPPIESAFRA